MTDPSDATGVGGESGPIDAPPPGGSADVGPARAAGPTEPLPLDLEPAPRGRTGFVVVAVILVVVVGAVILVAVLAGRKSGYSAEDREKFMSACTAVGGDPVKNTCGCIYDQMSQKVPYERYVAIDADLQSQRATAENKALQFPPEVESIRATCISSTKPTVKEPPTSQFQDRPTVKEPGSGP